MNRHERRQQARFEQKIQNKITRVNAANGSEITLEAMKTATQKGFEEGLRRGEINGAKLMAAVLMLELNKKFGFGRGRICRLLDAAVNQYDVAFDPHEQVEELYKRTGVKLRFDDEHDDFRPWGE